MFSNSKLAIFVLSIKFWLFSRKVCHKCIGSHHSSMTMNNSIAKEAHWPPHDGYNGKWLSWRLMHYIQTYTNANFRDQSISFAFPQLCKLWPLWQQMKKIHRSMKIFHLYDNKVSEASIKIFKILDVKAQFLVSTRYF